MSKGSKKLEISIELLERMCTWGEDRMRQYTQYMKDTMSVVRHTASNKTFVCAPVNDEVFVYIEVEQISVSLAARIYPNIAATKRNVFKPKTKGHNSILVRLFAVPWEDFFSQYEYVESYKDDKKYQEVEKGSICFSNEGPMIVRDVFFITQYKEKSIVSHIYGPEIDKYEHMEFDAPGLFESVQHQMTYLNLAMELAGGESLSVSFEHEGTKATLTGYPPQADHIRAEVPPMSKTSSVCLRWLDNPDAYNHKAGYKLLIKKRKNKQETSPK